MTTAGFTPHIVCESGSLSTITALVVAGLGITILPGSAVRVDQTQLRAIQLLPGAPTRTVQAAWRADSFHAVSATAFMDFVRHRKI